MTALEQWMYRDPMEAAMRLEAQSCKGCVFECPVKAFGQQVGMCAKGKPYGQKCKEFRLTKERVTR
jgi:hypothetical protein